MTSKSRVAKAPVNMPADVVATINENSITLKGPMGTLTQPKNKLVSIKENAKTLTFEPINGDSEAKAQAGTMRAIVSNMVKGVSQGFVKVIELVGVGYRANVKDKALVLSLGYSHTITYDLPPEISVETPNVTTIQLKGACKQNLGQIAAEIRAFRKPEPYKGKGVRYAGERVAKKVAKKK